MNVRKINWLILIVVHDFLDTLDQENLEKIINNEIQPAGVNDSHAVLLVRKSIHLNNTPVPGVLPYSFKTSIQELKKNPTGGYEFHSISELDFDFHAERSWVKLMKWVKKYYAAEHICLNTISHGAGFGIEGDKPADQPEFGSIAIIPDFAIKYFSKERGDLVIQKAGKRDIAVITPGGNLNSCKSLQMLWISELMIALKVAYGKRKIDLLLFNNCYMQVYENAWMLSKQINYLIAAETQFFSYGFNYKNFLERINQDILITPEQLIRTILPDLKDKWNFKGYTEIENISVSVLDLNNFQKAIPCFETITDFLYKLPEMDIKDIINLRKEKIRSVSIPVSSGITSGRVVTVDLIYFLKLMSDKYIKSKVFTNRINKFIDLIENKCRVDFYEGENLKKYDSRNPGKYCVHGLAIYLPYDLQAVSESEVMNCAYFGKWDPTSQRDMKIPLILFKKRSQWDDFIEKILNAM